MCDSSVARAVILSCKITMYVLIDCSVSNVTRPATDIAGQRVVTQESPYPNLFSKLWLTAQLYVHNNK